MSQNKHDTSGTAFRFIHLYKNDLYLSLNKERESPLNLQTVLHIETLIDQNKKQPGDVTHWQKGHSRGTRVLEHQSQPKNWINFIICELYTIEKSRTRSLFTSH